MTSNDNYYYFALYIIPAVILCADTDDERVNLRDV